MNEAVIALGSNINPKENVNAALDAIDKAFSLIKKSQFIFTKPLGYENQPDFLNGAVLIQTVMEKAGITDELKRIETKLGRKRKGHKNGPRTIDLDLVLFNERVLDDDVFERDFLKQSIQELLPGVKLGV
ncbi:MAG TPA: 2-amino-4-hydroxy-6-hydroxymethyldihydropteridine diphosphokinase [Balneolaceae bacterium]|nr:2-amino-4-hydroxy-6-hydroxymethyldihydropteridine diphosphokinase [Balneolaceae bacterium]